jgi:hypothetical protein
MVDALIQTISRRRFETYLYAAGYNEKRAIALHLWNAKLGASFHIPIQAVEISLRNKINHALMAEFGQDWWKNEAFNSLIDRERKRDLKVVRSRIAHKSLSLETDQIVASLSFGFWVGMLQPKYNPEIWSKQLRLVFPALPLKEDRDTLFRLAGRVADFRNRISHHEPLIKSNAMGIYGDVLKLLRWICPETELWIRPHCDIPKIVRQKP